MKSNTTVEKWEKLSSLGLSETQKKAISYMHFHSVQEAKAERDREWMMGMYQMFGNSKGGSVGMAILASLKQEEET